MKLTSVRNLATAAAVASVGLAGCSAGGAPASVTQANVNANVLTLAVGTANIFGDTPAAAVVGLNVAATYRQPAGALAPGSSAVLVSSPALTGPLALPKTVGSPGADATSTVLTGPTAGEIASSSITATPQNTTTTSSFGTSGGVFGLGIEPFNYGDGSPFTNVPYPVPLYDTVAADPNAFVPWGGPPAFDLAGNGQSVVGNADEPHGQAGLSEGLDVFAGVTPKVGAYSLSVSVPANTGTTTTSTTASLTSAALLGAVAPAVPTLDGAGGGSFTAVLPAGVTEAYVQITDVGAPAGATGCNTASTGAPLYYTIELKAGTPTGTLPDNAGPGGTPSICTAAQNSVSNKAATAADAYFVQTVGFDYPLYENSYVTGTTKPNPSPVLTGATGQADVTISSSAAFNVPAAAAAAMHARMQAIRRQALRHR